MFNLATIRFLQRFAVLEAYKHATFYKSKTEVRAIKKANPDLKKEFERIRKSMA